MRHGAAAFAATRHRDEQGHEGLRPGRQGRARRADRSADGRDHPRRSSRKSAAAWPAGGNSRPCRSAGRPAAACRRRWPTRPSITRHWRRSGAIMGSGGLVVLDDTDCMVDIARYFLRFTQDQSCGKCTFCRIGTRRMLDILDRLCDGPRQARRPGRAGRAGPAGQARAACAASGRTAPNPVLSTLRYFREEYEAHLAGRCPAGKCKALIGYAITDDCIGCTLCAQQCPADAIPMTPYAEARDRPGEMHPLRHVPADMPGKGGGRGSDENAAVNCNGHDCGAKYGVQRYGVQSRRRMPADYLLPTLHCC